MVPSSSNLKVLAGGSLGELKWKEKYVCAHVCVENYTLILLRKNCKRDEGDG